VSLMLPAPTQRVVDPQETYGTTGCWPPGVSSVCGWPHADPLYVIEWSAPSSATQNVGLAHDTLVSSDERSELLGSIGAGADHVVPLYEIALAAPSIAMQNDAVGHDTEKNPAPELGSIDAGWDHEAAVVDHDVGFGIARDAERRRRARHALQAVLRVVAGGNRRVDIRGGRPRSGVRERVAFRVERDAERTRDAGDGIEPLRVVLSTFTGADQAPLPAGAFVGAPLFGVVRNDGNEIVGVEVEPHATASNPADAAAAMESRRRLTDANGTNDLRFSFIEASTAGAPNGA
jgi:hypothetical protein